MTNNVKAPRRKKILWISDDLRIASGVGSMSLRIITHLRKKYDFCHVGAAVRHQEKDPVTWNSIRIYPSSGFGNPMFLRQILSIEKPDAILLFTDPRFFTWIWMMEDEIRDHIPICYYHVWDNFPAPQYNKYWYESCDFISCISKTTHEIVKSFGRPCNYNPHGIDPNEFLFLDENTREDNRKKLLGRKYDPNAFIVAWLSRNIRRKSPSGVISGFCKFVDKRKEEDQKKMFLIMHTDPIDNDGTDLWRVHRDLFKKYNITFSHQKQPPQYLNALYNAADVTVNTSVNEGWGLSATESLMSGTPIIVSLTGGLKDQVEGIDGKYTGIGIEAAASNLAGSPATPYIYEDYINIEDYVFALETIYNMSKEERNELRKHCRRTGEVKFNVYNMVRGIDEMLETVIRDFKPRAPWAKIKI